VGLDAEAVGEGTFIVVLWRINGTGRNIDYRHAMLGNRLAFVARVNGYPLISSVRAFFEFFRARENYT
jgi:hypothetical protein